jgi:curved DNA-binding protein CbpA
LNDDRAGISAMTKATATGNLASTPFCELLVYALSQTLSGSLVFERPDRSKHALLFHQGAPVKARVADPQLRIGELLLARGAIDEGAQRAAEAGAEAELYGQRLVAHDAIAPDALSRALDDQLYQQIAWFASMPGATAFAYYADADLLASWGAEHRQLDPLACIWQAVQANPPSERIALACQGLSDKTLRLHAASRINRFGFANRERPVLDVLRVKPQNLAALRATGLLDPAALERLLYVLTVTRHLDTGEAPLGVTTGTRPIPVQSAPRRRAPSSAQRPIAVPPPEPEAAAEPAPARRELKETGRFAGREEIEAKHQKLEQLNHYEVLEVERTSSNEQIAGAFAALVRRWHPDRLSPDLGDLKEISMRVFARMTEAYRTLGHAGSRQEYDQSLGSSDPEVDTEQAQVIRVLRAAEAFQKAEILLRKRDLDGAEKFASAALAGDKDQPEYAALYAWIRARKAGATEADIASALEVLKGAVMQQHDNVKIRYYLAGVFKLSGQENAALREYRFVAENDPSNLDAARELRLHDLRRQNAPAQPAGEGLFGRLFKR